MQKKKGKKGGGGGGLQASSLIYPPYPSPIPCLIAGVSIRFNRIHVLV